MIQSLLKYKNNNNLSLISNINNNNNNSCLLINNIYYFIIIIHLYLILIVNCNNTTNSFDQIQFQQQQHSNNNNENTNEETEIIVIDNGFRPLPHVYHFEDFFWTGSGDGGSNDNTVTVTKHWPIVTDSLDNEVKPTVYLTSTVTSTVIITRTSDINEKNDENTTSSSSNCMQTNCEESSTVSTTTVVTPSQPINPTKTSEWENVSTTTTKSSSAKTDEQTWWNIPSTSTQQTILTDSSSTIITTTTTDEGDGVSTGGMDDDDDDDEVNTITIIIDTHRYQVPDRKYWIITVLEDTITHSNRTINITTTTTSFNTLPSVQVFENRLAILYHIAFYRQQQKHLGIQNNNRSKRSILINKHDASGGGGGGVVTNASSISTSELYIKKRSLEKINVQIHNISTNNENNNLELVYSVRVAGQPVPAKTAANDMRLVTNDEVIKQFGSYTVKTKAEPYLKDETKPLGLARYENTWLFIGTAIGILIILLIILILIIFGIQHRTKKHTGSARLHTTKAQSKSIINEEDDDNDDMNTTTTSRVIQSVLRMEDAEVQTCARLTNYIPTAITKTTNTLHKSVRNIHVSSSSESPSSSDTVCSFSPSPASRRRYNQWKHHGNRDFEYEQDGADQHINQQMLDDYDGGYKEVVDATNIVAIRKASDVRSAHSYLSMPSVKNFPRGSIPEPLSRVLEPVSIRHLDDGMITPIESPMKTPPTLMRHGSMQEAEDPGVIGPLVWNQHCQKLNQAIQPTNNEAPNVGRMKKRFQELLDDAFSLFGSRSVSPEDQPQAVGAGGGPPPQISSVRAHSAYPRLSSTDDIIESRIQQRPKTSIPGRKSQYPSTTSGHIEPKCAWTGSSGTPSPLVRGGGGGGRPLSAGPFHRPTLAPHICPVRILPEGRLDASDTAVPVIEAIKSELRKCGQTCPTPRKK